MLHRGSSYSLVRAMDDRIIMRCGIISSRQSAATSEIVKALLGMRHRVSSAIKYRTFTFIFLFKNCPQSVAWCRNIKAVFEHRKIMKAKP